jgi:TRAP-type C4-dicarboxylate transport system permease large subunit
MPGLDSGIQSSLPPSYDLLPPWVAGSSPATTTVSTVCAAALDPSHAPIASRVCVTVFVLGMFLDGIGVMIVIVPILLPVAQGFGIDPIHFGVVIAVATLTGLITPPVGPGLYIAMDATGLRMMQIFRATLPFFAAFLLVMLVIVLVPQLSTMLPTVLGF